MEVKNILVNRYEICQHLSKKAARETFLAKDLHTQQLVVIKTLQFAQDFQWDDLKLFEREAKTLQNLNHPGIPKYLDYFEAEMNNTNSFFLVQTYIDAPSLETIINNGRKFSEPEIIELAESFLNILTYLHEQIPPIIHRDIKPSNILLTNRSGNSIGDIYLVDFGSVQTVANKDSGTMTIVGSYGYMPFEQFSGQTTTSSDLYSFGMTLIYLINGVHPADLPQVNGRVQFHNSTISSKLSAWLEKMTHPYLDKRFDSAKVAISDLKSESKNNGDYLHLKPANSNVNLYRDGNRLKIECIKQHSLEKFITTPIVTIFLSIIFMFSVQGSGVLFFVLLIILMSVYLINIDIKSCDNKLYSYKILSIDKNLNIKIGISNNSEPTKWQQSSLFREINLLAYNSGYTFDSYLNDKGQLVKVNQAITIQPKLSIYAGGIEYEIGNDEYQLSQAELLWLGQELSDFLELEMQFIYPTPVVPPEFSCGGGC